MKINKLFLLFLFVNSTFGFSQITENSNYWIVKFNPTHTIDFFTFPTISVAAEKRITPHFSINIEIGNQFFDFRNKDVDTIFNASKGFKSNVEGRYYWKKNSHFYNGVQLFYRQNEFTRTITYSQKQTEENAQGYRDNFGVNKTATGVILLIGYQYITSFNLVFETYFGGGLLNRQIKNNNREFDKSKDIEALPVDKIIYPAAVDLSESSGNTIILTIGFRVGYKF